MTPRKTMVMPDGTSIPENSPTIDVFVYGTLKVGCSLAAGLDQYRISHCKGTTRGVLYRGLRYPMLIRSACVTDIVSGEVHTYPEAVLEILDMIEGYNVKNPLGSLFTREKMPVYPRTSRSSIPISMYAYLWKRPLESNFYPIANGTWKEDINLENAYSPFEETGDLS